MARHWNADMSWRNWRIWMNTFSYLGLYLLGFFVHLLLQFFFYSGFFQAINPPFNTLSSMIRMCRVGRKKQNKVMLMFPYKNKLLSREKTKKKKRRMDFLYLRHETDFTNQTVWIIPSLATWPTQTTVSPALCPTRDGLQDDTFIIFLSSRMTLPGQCFPFPHLSFFKGS